MVALSLSLALLGLLVHTAAAASPKSNFVVMLADDMGWCVHRHGLHAARRRRRASASLLNNPHPRPDVHAP